MGKDDDKNNKKGRGKKLQVHCIEDEISGSEDDKEKRKIIKMDDSVLESNKMKMNDSILESNKMKIDDMTIGKNINSSSKIKNQKLKKKKEFSQVILESHLNDDKNNKVHKDIPSKKYNDMNNDIQSSIQLENKDNKYISG